MRARIEKSRRPAMPSGNIRGAFWITIFEELNSVFLTKSTSNLKPELRIWSWRDSSRELEIVCDFMSDSIPIPRAVLQALFQNPRNANRVTPPPSVIGNSDGLLAAFIADSQSASPSLPLPFSFGNNPDVASSLSALSGGGLGPGFVLYNIV